MANAARALAGGPTAVTSDDAVVEVRDICKNYGDVEALRGINLEFERGKLTTLLGPSGCGKTTLLKIIAGLVPATSGEIRVNGRAVNSAERHRIARRYIEQVGLAGFEEKYPHELSGGMRQRVGIARAFAVNADVMLLDEPFSAVDEQNRRKFQEDLLRLVEMEKKTFIFVTHSIEEAVYVSDRIVLLSPRPGRVSQIIDPMTDRTATPDEIRRDARYLDVVEEIWQGLRQYAE